MRLILEKMRNLQKRKRSTLNIWALERQDLTKVENGKAGIPTATRTEARCPLTNLSSQTITRTVIKTKTILRAGIKTRAALKMCTPTTLKNTISRSKRS